MTEESTPETLDDSKESSSLPDNSLRTYINGVIAEEINIVTRYLKETHILRNLHTNDPLLSSMVKSHVIHKHPCLERLCESLASPGSHRGILLDGILNYEYDIEGLLGTIRSKLTRYDRVITVLYNPYFRGLYRLANKLGLRKAPLPTTFITATDLENIISLAGFEAVKVKPVAYCPFKLMGIGDIINRLIAIIPLIRALSFAWVVTLRPLKPNTTLESLTIVIPARNEKGNIEGALTRMPDFGVTPEIIFVEGHSKDGTWEEIQRVAEAYAGRFPIKCLQQTGKGKADAVRLGFSEASGTLLTILDADLTMPPELLVRFYDAWHRGKADFVNGNRLVYPIEGKGMKFLNWLGNIFFAKLLSFVLDTSLGDSLCGTKLFAKEDYERFIQWREDFGDFDPFGDYELIFPACVMGLGIIDMPIRYRDRVYGSTNIRRFYHGLMLLKMTWIGLYRIKLGFNNHSK